MLMWKKVLIPALAAALQASPLQAGQFMMGIGPFTFAEDGLDLQVSYRPDQSHWQYGYRYVRWTDTFEDPFTGRSLTKTTETITGPLVNYLFTPEARWTWYVGASVYRWSIKDKSLITGEIGSDSTIAPYFGGGFMGLMGKSFYYNAGILLSPTAKLSTSTSVSSEENSGGFDIQIHLGITF